MSTTIAITDCTEARKGICDAEFRSCQRMVTMTNDGIETKTTEEEFCTSCMEGYVEWDEAYGIASENPSSSSSSANQRPSCIDIFDHLNVEDYEQTYQPFYPNLTSKVSGSRRFDLLKKAGLFIAAHNRQQQLGNEVVANEDGSDELILALNEYSADTEDEVKQRTGYIFIDVAGTSDELPHVEVSETDDEPPFSVDYVAMGAVTSVKKQGRCGSSWAISLAGAIEGATYLQSRDGTFESLSFQQYISCNQRNLACLGGNLVIGMQYTAKTPFGGLSTLNHYPYTDYGGEATHECSLGRDSGIPLAVEVAQPRIAFDFNRSPFEHGARLSHVKRQLARFGPISMVMRSNCELFTNYKRGIFTDDGACACSAADCTDHAVLMVGYNDLAEIPYFTFKNSWGEHWGEGGYFRVAQTPKGEYGLFGILAHGVVAGDKGVIDVNTIVPDAPQDSSLSAGMILLIIAAILCACVFAVIGIKHFFYSDDKLRPSPEDDQPIEEDTSTSSPEITINDNSNSDKNNEQQSALLMVPDDDIKEVEEGESGVIDGQATKPRAFI